MPTVLITGVNRGLGLEFIKQYAAAGWAVIGTCRDPDNASASQAVAASAPNVTLHKLDVSDAEAVSALADTLKDTSIDVLILNAGLMAERTGLGTFNAEDFLQVLNVNVVAPAMLIQAFAGHVAASERKIIVGMGSTLGRCDRPTDPQDALQGRTHTRTRPEGAVPTRRVPCAALAIAATPALACA